MSVCVCVRACVRACVCVYVCLSAIMSSNYVTSRPIFTKFLCILPMAVAWSTSGGVVICYVLPVSWMTSYLLIRQDCSTLKRSAHAALHLAISCAQ